MGKKGLNLFLYTQVKPEKRFVKHAPPESTESVLSPRNAVTIDPQIDQAVQLGYIPPPEPESYPPPPVPPAPQPLAYTSYASEPQPLTADPPAVNPYSSYSSNPQPVHSIPSSSFTVPIRQQKPQPLPTSLIQNRPTGRKPFDIRPLPSSFPILPSSLPGRVLTNSPLPSLSPQQNFFQATVAPYPLEQGFHRGAPQQSSTLYFSQIFKRIFARVLFCGC